jgi:hypothetical protein
MKKTLSILLALCICLLPLYTGCANESPVSVDLDLSVMSSTIVYAEMYNIQFDPGQYLGKVIRLRGLYSYYREPSTGVSYYACVVPDATACCMQGMEFVPPAGGLPAEEGETVTVTGRLAIYQEGGVSWLHLVDTDVVCSGDSGAS